MATAAVLSSKASEEPMYHFFAHTTAFTYTATVTEEDAKHLNEHFPKDGPTVTAQSAKRLILHHPDLIKVQRYLVYAQKLPSTKDRFEHKHPRKDVEDYLVDKDNQLYQDMENVCLDIYNHADEKFGSVVGDILNLGGLISNFAGKAKEYVTDLHANLKIITTPGATLQQDAVKQAFENAHVALTEMEKVAKAREGDCDKLVKVLTDFQNKTKNDKNKLDDVDSRFNKHLPEINKELAELTTEITKLQQEAKKLHDKYDNLVAAAASTPAFLLVPIFGWIAAPIMAGIWGSQAVAVKEKYDSDLKSIAQKEVKKLAVIEVLNLVKSFGKETADVEASISAALGSLGSLKVMFSKMHTEFTSMKEHLASADDWAGTQEIKYGRVVLEDLDKAASEWETIVKIARDFQENGGIEVTEQLI